VDCSTIAGGTSNVITGNGLASVIGGGQQNTNWNKWATIGGGLRNTIGYGESQTIAGGVSNSIRAYRATIGGGDRNRIEQEAGWSTIAGGRENEIHAGNGANGETFTFIGGGKSNLAYSAFGTIAGGLRNTIAGESYDRESEGATISGGGCNWIDYGSHYATIGGGYGNKIDIGDYLGTGSIGGGYSNLVWGKYGTVPGGDCNHASDYAFAAGHRAKARHRGSFVWADSTEADFISTTDNEFAVRAGGGVRLATGYTVVSGSGNEQAYVGGDGSGGDVEIGSRNAAILNVGFWNPAAGQHMNLYAQSFNIVSDMNAKQDFKPVDAQAVLEKVAALPVQAWAYKGEGQIRHLGPTAQDFQAAFELGSSDTSIATVDADGVALAAIQGLSQIVKEKEARITDLEKTVGELKAIVTALHRKVNGGAQ